MFGAVEAIPIMAVAGFLANLSRALAWWRSIAWNAVLAYALPGMPAAALGAYTLIHLPAGWPEAMLGLFIMALVPIRRMATAGFSTAGIGHLALTGALVGFLTGIFLSTGPLSVPAFLAFGLVRGAFIATEAAASLLVQAASFREFGAMTVTNMLRGVVIGGALMAGTFPPRRGAPWRSSLQDDDGCRDAGVRCLASGIRSWPSALRRVASSQRFDKSMLSHEPVKADG